MSELNLTNIASTSIAIPPAGVSAIFTDLDKRLRVKDDAGFIMNANNLYNFSVASQAPGAAARTYIVGSMLSVPSSKLQIGSCFRWQFNMTKTAAGVAASTFDICFGTAGTTADTARVSFVKPAGTAAVDEAQVTITAICRGPLSASGVVVGTFSLVHNLAATGHAIIPCVVVTTISSAFSIIVPNLKVGLCITSGAADAITIQNVIAEAWNL